MVLLSFYTDLLLISRLQRKRIPLSRPGVSSAAPEFCRSNRPATVSLVRYQLADLETPTLPAAQMQPGQIGKPRRIATLRENKPILCLEGGGG